MLVCVALAAPACAQTADGAAARAQANARIVPLPSLAQRAPDPVDVQDEVILSRFLFGDIRVEDLTEEQGEELVAAATRRLDRRKAELERAKELVEEGALARLALTPLILEMDRARRTLNLAESRARLLRELAAIARQEAEEALRASEPRPEAPGAPAERFDGLGILRPQDFTRVATAFRKQFARALPVSARGGTALHRALGFDHRGRYDVAVDPDQPEGVWLRNLLKSWKIPYYAFRAFLPGRATGPHIHIGPPSPRLARGG